MFCRHSTPIINTCCSRFLAVTDGWRTNCSQAQTLGSLLASSITGLVGMPDLLTVVAKLRSTAFSSTCQLGAAGTSKRDHSVSLTSRGARENLVNKTSSKYRTKLTRQLLEQLKQVQRQWTSEPDHFLNASSTTLLPLHWIKIVQKYYNHCNTHSPVLHAVVKYTVYKAERNIVRFTATKKPQFRRVGQ